MGRLNVEEESYKAHLVGHVAGGETQTPLVTVAAKQLSWPMLASNRLRRRNTRRVVIVILRSARNIDPREPY